MRAARQGERMFRYHVLQNLGDIGFFAFLQEPRTYGQILTEFGFVDIEYTRSLMNILSSDKDTVLAKEGDLYHTATENPVPDLNQILRETDPRMKGFMLLAEGLTDYILPRMRQEPISLSKTFEQDGREFMFKFDKLLATRLYSAMRNACFAYLTGQERAWLQGKKLLEVGCGSGRETAELWSKYNGDIQITAFDVVPSMIEHAQENFEKFLKEIDPDHPPVTAANRPVFKLASATRMPFDDDEFDAAFWALVLHWTPDPRKSIHETARVVRPGGLIFGMQSLKPTTDNYLDFMIRSNENCYGFFWPQEYRRWLTECGLDIDLVPFAGLLRAYNRKDGQR
jgi:ubiquinone/menaquinone biosynthesis C-methylase UbiE